MTEKDIKRRNDRLLSLFTDADINVRLIGKPDTPAIVWEDSYILSAYVHNFYLKFTDKPYDSEVVKEYKLKVDTKPSCEELTELIKGNAHRPAYRINLGDMFLVGYNYNPTDDSLYPVFARYNPKIYFTKEKAEQVIDMLRSDGYEVELTYPKSLL